MAHEVKSLSDAYFVREHKFDALIKSLTDLGIGLSIIKKDMRIAWVNQVISDIFGPPEKIFGQYCYKIYAHREKICPHCPTAKALRTGKSRFEAIQRGFDQNGTTQYHRVISTPIKIDGCVVEALEIIQDVTKGVLAERQKKKSQKRLKKTNWRLTRANKVLVLKTKRLSKATQEIKRLNQRLKEQIQHTSLELDTAIKELNTVYSVSREIISTLDLHEVFSLITKVVCSIIRTKACVVRMLDQDKKWLVIVASYGVSSRYLDNSPLKIGEGLAGIIVKTARSIICPQVSREESVKYSYYINKEGYQSALGVPIIFKNEILGAILAYDETIHNYTKTEEILLSTFASQVAVAIKNAQLYEKVHLNYFDTVSALAKACEARDPYTQGHAERVTTYALDIAQAMGLPKKQVQAIKYCGKLHDVGKIAVPDTILSKPGPLTEKERQIIRLHPLKGVDMLAPLKFLEAGFPLIRHHHERFDGKGYPQGLAKSDIPIIARIFACADAFDAMTSDRPYRSKLTFEKAIVELRDNAGSQFDPCVVKKFLLILKGKIKENKVATWKAF